ncbi:MAG: thioesterase [Oscillospiraceae bacterium]|nr:thioesterase [Oscillospiraceae bacterium]
MSIYYDETHTISTRDAGLYNQCRPSALLGILQDTATNAALSIHLDQYALLAQYNVIWMLARIWFRLERPLFHCDEILIRTWHRGNRRATIYRDFDIYQNGVKIGEAVSNWVLADQGTRKLFRPTNIPAFLTTDGGALCKEIILNKLRMPQQIAQVPSHTFHFSDIDLNGHVNNVKYADVVCDALALDRSLDGHFVSSFQINYLAECRCGETMTLYAGEQDGVSYAGGTDRDGNERFVGALTLTPLPMAHGEK